MSDIYSDNSKPLTSADKTPTMVSVESRIGTAKVVTSVPVALSIYGSVTNFFSCKSRFKPFAVAYLN